MRGCGTLRLLRCTLSRAARSQRPPGLQDGGRGSGAEREMKHVRCHAALGPLSPPRALIHIPDVFRRLSLLLSPVSFFASLMRTEPPPKETLLHTRCLLIKCFSFFSPETRQIFLNRAKQTNVSDERLGVCVSSKWHQARLCPNEAQIVKPTVSRHCKVLLMAQTRLASAALSSLCTPHPTHTHSEIIIMIIDARRDTKATVCQLVGRNQKVGVTYLCTCTHTQVYIYIYLAVFCTFVEYIYVAASS